MKGLSFVQKSELKEGSSDESETLRDNPRQEEEEDKKKYVLKQLLHVVRKRPKFGGKVLKLKRSSLEMETRKHKLDHRMETACKKVNE